LTGVAEYANKSYLALTERAIDFAAKDKFASISGFKNNPMDENIIKAFTGSEIEVILLQGELEENGISSLVRDGFSSGLRAGFYGGSPSAIELYIAESDQEKAEPIIREFIQNREAAG
jgi:hypothetical protein